VRPRLFVIPKLNAFDAALAGETQDVAPSSRPDPISNGHLLGGAISQMDNDTVKENGIAAYPQLNGVEETILTSHLDPVMVPSAVNLRIPQEIPYLPLRGQTTGAGKTQKTRQNPPNALAWHQFLQRA